SEDTPVFDWTITTDKKEVEGYPCILATTHFRGRDYEAWFTQDIPLPEGPWMFGGLPGLIMEIRDTQYHYVFKCIGVRQIKDGAVPIKYFNRPYEEGSREKIRSTVKKMYGRLQQWAQSQGHPIIVGKTFYDDIMMVYNPIELE
ncbi:MAG: GLPGLI family protein, partial [Prevotella sp.]|nr:GLPGLI family protein [Prevotella sp.]